MAGLTSLSSSFMAGSVVTMVLSDGSVVRFRPGTQVQFPPSADRHVVLSGTAFFAVASGERPFVVETDGGEVTVHGTRFEVRSEGTETRVVVVEGVVGLSGAAGSAEVSAGQVAYVTKGSAPRVLDRDDPWSLLEWEGGLLLFQETPLAEVADELGRHFGRRVRLDQAVAERRITAWFGDEPWEEVVSALCLVAGARCEVGDSVVTMGGR
jgi:transmembrane sensor